MAELLAELMAELLAECWMLLGQLIFPCPRSCQGVPYLCGRRLYYIRQSLSTIDEFQHKTSEDLLQVVFALLHSI
jgi:hypothetical protein